jgi:hypothetical protein
MKTFLEFVTEAELIENDQQEFAQLRAKIKMLQSRGRPGDAEEIKKLTQQAAELQMGTQAKIGAQLNKDKPQKPVNKNTITGGGYASKPRDTKGESGSLPNVGRPSDEGEVVSGRFGNQTGKTGSGGTGDARSGGKIGSR